MSTIRSKTRLVVEDFPDQKGWIGKLIQPINDFLTEAIKILNGGVTFADQMLGKDHLFSFEYQSESITFPIGFQWTLAQAPKSLLVASSTEDDAAIAVAVAWQYTNDGQVQLTSVVKLDNSPGVNLLTAGSRYKIRVRVTP